MVCRLTLCGLLVWCVSAMVNAECTSSGCSQETSTILACPPGTFQERHYCIPNDICPPNTVYRNGVCESQPEQLVSQCPAPYTFKHGVCINELELQSCSFNPQNCIVSSDCQAGNCDKNVQMNCGPSMINYNGGCAPLSVATCPISTTLQGGWCVRQNTCTSNSCGSGNIVCPNDSTMVGNTCERNTPCNMNYVNVNGACATCPYNYAPERGDCKPQPNIITTPPVIPAQPPVVVVSPPAAPVIVYVPTPPKETVVIHSENIVKQVLPSNHLNVIDITNIVNTSNIHNVVTNINGININNITLGSRTGAQNNNELKNLQAGDESDLYREDDSVRYEETCCVIMEPRTCFPSGDKFMCFHRRHHKCGEGCRESGSDPEVLISYQMYPDTSDTSDQDTHSEPEPEPEPAPEPENGNTGVPMPYPGQHYPYTHPYPHLSNPYQGMPYPGQPHSYPTTYSGQPSPMPYPFPGGHNVGIPMQFQGQPYSLPYQFPGVQHSGLPMQYPGQPNPMQYPGQPNPMPYPYPSHNIGIPMPDQHSHPSVYPGGLLTGTSPSSCVQQQTWPFVNCAQNVKIDCNQCQQTKCHPMCY